MSKLPFIPVAEPDLSTLEEDLVLEAVRSGWVSSIGAFIDRFEADFAAFCGTQEAIAVSNGTTALHITLVAKGIGPGDEVIVPDLTFVATAAAVLHCGATPVFVDVKPETWCVDPPKVREAITPRTRAVIAVHLFGHPADMTQLLEISDEHGLFLIEDAAEAHGASYGGSKVGSIGNAGTFSFYGNKLLTTGEGGCITTNDAEFAQRVRFLKDHAMSKTRRYFHPEVGFNYRMTNIQAALGCAQLERFPEILARKAAILQWYREDLKDSGLMLNPHQKPASPVCWLAVATLPSDFTEQRRDKILRLMREHHNIDTRPFFVPMHELPPYEGYRFVGAKDPVSSSLGTRGVCLPSSTKLDRASVTRVTNALVGCMDATK